MWAGFSLILSIFFFALVPQGFAWNKTSHMITGAIAYLELQKSDPGAIREIIRLLQSHPYYEDRWARMLKQPDLDEEEQEMYLFMLAARWPDDIRHVGTYHRDAWHYVYFPYHPENPADSTDFREPAGENLLHALRHNTNLLQSGIPDSAKAIALSWIFHCLGDIHQPLHTATLVNEDYRAPEGDRGGQDFYIQPTPGLRASTLHHYWNNLVDVPDRFHEVREMASHLLRIQAYSRNNLLEGSGMDPDEWARESFGLAIREVYREGKLDGSVDHHNLVPLPDGYDRTARHVGERQLVQAGYRLSDMLSQLF